MQDLLLKALMKVKLAFYSQRHYRQSNLGAESRRLNMSAETQPRPQGFSLLRGGERPGDEVSGKVAAVVSVVT